MNKGVNSLIILKRIIVIAVIFITTAFSLYCINSCSAITGGAKNFLNKIGINYYNDTMEYCFRLERTDIGFLSIDNQPDIILSIERKENILIGYSDVNEKYTFVSLKDDRFLYQEKNMMFFNENMFISEGE